MKKIIYAFSTLAIVILAYSASGCEKKKSVTASKKITTETREVSSFDKVNVEGFFSVDVTYGSSEKLEVEAPENLHQYVEATVKDGKLFLSFNKNIGVNSRSDIQIHINTAKLNDFNTSGASSITLNNTLKDDELSIKSSGAASFNGEIDVKDADIKLDGAANVNLYGGAVSANLYLSGASQVNDYDFEVNNLSVNLSGASSVTISSLKSIKGDISGASSLIYKGNPKVKKVSVSGAAKVKEE